MPHKPPANPVSQPAYSTVFVILLTLGYLTHTNRMTPWCAGLLLECGQIVCYILLITIDHVIAKYVFVCMATAATSSFFPILWPGKWNSWSDARTHGNLVSLTQGQIAERIRATSGTTNAGLAIGMTNVSRSRYHKRLRVPGGLRVLQTTGPNH